MQFIKYILLFFIFIASNLIGKMFSQKYTLRLQELAEMKNALNIFKTKIRFTYAPIGEVFTEISQQTKRQTIKQLFENAKKGLETRNSEYGLDKCFRRHYNKHVTR